MMKWKYFKLIISAMLAIAMLACLLTEQVLMAIFFVMALILSELEDIHDTLKQSNKEVI
jgi:hypothetical protein